MLGRLCAGKVHLDQLPDSGLLCVGRCFSAGSAEHQSCGKEDKWEHERGDQLLLVSFRMVHSPSIIYTKTKDFLCLCTFSLEGKSCFRAVKAEQVQNEKLMHSQPTPLRPLMQRKSFCIRQKLLPLDFDPHSR